MRKIILSLGLAGTIMSVAAQHKEDWLRGQVRLSNGECLEGKLIYASNVESLSVKLEDGTQKTYSSSQLHSFHFLDTHHQLVRYFKKSILPNEGREAVVEVVFDGDLQVQRCFRPKHRRYRSQPTTLNYFPLEPYEHGRYQYFVHDGICLQTIEGFLHKNYKQKTGRWRKHLELFRYRNQLDNGIVGWLKMLAYYNELEHEYQLRRVLPQVVDSTQLAVQHYF